MDEAEETTEENAELSNCPHCDIPMSEKTGKYGIYLNCHSCGHKAPKVTVHGVCPKCSKKTLLKDGKFGKYIACEDYAPKNAGQCNYTAQIAEDGTIKEKKLANVVEGIKCPKCFKPVVSRAGQYGEFFSCSGYPDCKTIVNSDGTIKLPKGKGKK